MKNSKMYAAVIVVIVALVAYGSLFVVDQWQLALKFRLGQIVQTNFKPGLHFKLPFINNIRKYDGRILTLDTQPTEYLTKEKKNVIVDFFVKWRISNVENFYKRMSGGSERVARERLFNIINNGLKNEFSNRTIQEVVSGERSEIMANITQQANVQAKEFGIKVVDVRIKRIELPKEVRRFVYLRMSAERKRVANELRATGEEEAEKIRAEANRQKTVLLAEAYKQAQEIRGTGDARAANIYAREYRKNPEFYAFYRSLEAYRQTFNKSSDVLVLQPDSQFFKYFSNADGKRR